MQKNQRLERQFTMGFPLKPPGQISTNSAFKSGVPLSPRSRPADQPNLFSTSKVVKPIRGGGGDVWKFQSNNKGFEITNTANPQTAAKKIDRILNQKQGGITSMIKSFFG